MIKKEKGIALVSLIITIILMTIIASTVVYMSLDRFEINSLRKMFTDIELLEDKVSNYYLKFGVLPILRDDSNMPIQYNYSTLEFEKNSVDNNTYYILDVKAVEGISLNYGKEGFENPNTSQDVYIINEKSHTIYYVKGMVLDGQTYHTLVNNDNTIEDTIPPSSPQINVVSGIKNASGIYTTAVEIEIVPGKDSWSQINNTTYSINGSTEIDITTLKNNVHELKDDGIYTIVAKSYDNKQNFSQTTLIIEINREDLPISLTLNTASMGFSIVTDGVSSISTSQNTLTATLTNATGELTWVSSDEDVASISGPNNYTKTIIARKVGTATITVSYGEYSATCTVKVNELKVYVAYAQEIGVLSTTKNINVYDEYENKIVLPAGFKITTDADTVPEGIVIEDATYTDTIGSQFVWIPVGNVKSSEGTKTINLGRYVFADGYTDYDGDGTKEPAGSIVTSLSVTNPKDELKTISTSTAYYTEALKGETVKNKQARDIEAFISSAKTKGGYYIGRYEARNNNETVTTVATHNVWYLANQSTASSESREMYGDANETKRTFSSDLINSFAWDTAIVFIQAFGDNDYSRQGSLNKNSLAITGTQGITDTTKHDKVCNIWDMASNCREWSTESYSAYSYPYVVRGDDWGSGVLGFASLRQTLYANGSEDYSEGFRPILYVAP